MEDMIFNRYDNEKSGVAGKLQKKRNYLSYRKYVNGYAKEMGDKEEQPIFELIELETVNRCNSGCSFCPVNKKSDTREYCRMTDELFEKIIGELADLDYSYRLGLYSNNEPFLDEDIIRRVKYAREKLPKAFLEIYTNGTLLTLEQFLESLETDGMITSEEKQEIIEKGKITIANKTIIFVKENTEK